MRDPENHDLRGPEPQRDPSHIPLAKDFELKHGRK